LARQKTSLQEQPYCFTRGTIEQGIQAIKDLKEEAERLSPPPTEYAALATAGFRAAPCSDTLIDHYADKTGVEITTISQDEEARLAFNGVVARSRFDRKHAVSWETGGGSMQMVMERPDGSLVIYGTMGNVPFRNMVIQSQHKNPLTTFSPNPMSREDVDKAVGLAMIHASLLPAELKDKLKNSKTRVLATGGIIVTIRSAIKSPKRNTFMLKELENVLDNVMVGLTDEDITKELHGLDPSFSVSGLALIVGYMKALGIDKITLITGGLSEGAFVDPLYFEGTEHIFPEEAHILS